MIVVYSNNLHQIVLDFLSLFVGRSTQDITIPKDRKWFMQQTIPQKIWRTVLTFFVCYAFYRMIRNLTEMDNNCVSWQETVIPLAGYVVLWVMMCVFIAYEPAIHPEIKIKKPDGCTAKAGIDDIVTKFKEAENQNLYFGRDQKEFKYKTASFNFLQAYRTARMFTMLLYVHFTGFVDGSFCVSFY